MKEGEKISNKADMPRIWYWPAGGGFIPELVTQEEFDRRMAKLSPKEIAPPPQEGSSDV